MPTFRVSLLRNVCSREEFIVNARNLSSAVYMLSSREQIESHGLSPTSVNRIRDTVEDINTSLYGNECEVDASETDPNGENMTVW